MTLEQLRDTSLTPVQQTLLSYLRSCAAVAELNARPPEWVFGSVYHLLEAHGVFFTAAPRPVEVPKLPDRWCYGNAAATASTYAGEGLLYAEGFAAVAASGQVVPLPHGWCVTGDGLVVDPTWDFRPDTAYFGIVLRDPATWPHDGGGLLTEPDRMFALLRDGL
ncbi:hypothetical protein [Actinoplanes rectilineatus]|uniref:hypothetical protein n=1 Tax=Actinoplanes rectilineatus TaxID=113571 RepID=UPI0005F2B167|nr:hypothetical protein [Actinoplanes rectilineatus]